MPRYKYVTRESTIADAISTAYGEIEGLAIEMREMFDNVEGSGLANTARYQTISETADLLEGVSEPSVPDGVGELKVTYSVSIRTGKRGGSVSRTVRHWNAINILNTVMEALQEVEDDEEKPQDLRDEAETLKDEVQAIVDETEGAEFPGMYG